MINHSEMVRTLAKSGEKIAAEMNAEDAHLLHMVVGISGEAGELLDAIKKKVIYRKPLDRENVLEELGDLEFYLEGIRQGLGITREQCLEANIAKLSKRYEGLNYTDHAAQERADKKPSEGVLNIARHMGDEPASDDATRWQGDPFAIPGVEPEPEEDPRRILVGKVYDSEPPYTKEDLKVSGLNARVYPDIPVTNRVMPQAPMQDPRWVDAQDMKDFTEGTKVRHKGSDKTVYVVVGNFGSRATAFDAVDITNPPEWQIFRPHYQP